MQEVCDRVVRRVCDRVVHRGLLRSTVWRSCGIRPRRGGTRCAAGGGAGDDPRRLRTAGKRRSAGGEGAGLSARAPGARSTAHLRRGPGVQGPIRCLAPRVCFRGPLGGRCAVAAPAGSRRSAPRGVAGDSCPRRRPAYDRQLGPREKTYQGGRRSAPASEGEAWDGCYGCIPGASLLGVAWALTRFLRCKPRWERDYRVGEARGGLWRTKVGGTPRRLRSARGVCAR